MIPDLSQYRMVSLSEVAVLFKRAESTIKKQVQHGLFPVKPRDPARGKPLQWSSVDLRRYFDDPKVSQPRAAKRGPKAGAR